MDRRLTLSRYSTSHAKPPPCRFGTALRYPSLRRKLLGRLWNCGGALSKPRSCFRKLCGLTVDALVARPMLKGLVNLGGGQCTGASPEPRGSSSRTKIVSTVCHPESVGMRTARFGPMTSVTRTWPSGRLHGHDSQRRVRRRTLHMYNS